MTADPPKPGLEYRRVIVRRFLEARAAGMTRVEARVFAESGVDVGELRKLVERGCPPQAIAEILL